MYVIICAFCSQEKIYPEWRRKDFESRVNEKRFCSRTCVTKHRNKIHGNPMNNPAYIKKSIDNRPSQKGTLNYNYKDGRSFYTKYRKDFCEKCGAVKNKSSDKPLYVHHIDGDRTNSTPSNLLTVCASCHEYIHKRWL